MKGRKNIYFKEDLCHQMHIICSWLLPDCKVAIKIIEIIYTKALCQPTQ